MSYARKDTLIWQKGMYYHLYNRGARQVTIFRERMYSHSGTLFEGRFRAKAIQTTGHLLHLCRYIHGNPVKDGIVAEPGDWPYSDYLEWIGERPDVLVDRCFIQEQFSSLEGYRQFLAEYLKTFCLPDDVQKHIDAIER